MLWLRLTLTGTWGQVCLDNWILDHTYTKLSNKQIQTSLNKQEEHGRFIWPALWSILNSPCWINNPLFSAEVAPGACYVAVFELVRFCWSHGRFSIHFQYSRYTSFPPLYNEFYHENANNIYFKQTHHTGHCKTTNLLGIIWRNVIETPHLLTFLVLLLLKWPVTPVQLELWEPVFSSLLQFWEVWKLILTPARRKLLSWKFVLESCWAVLTPRLCSVTTLLANYFLLILS